MNFFTLKSTNNGKNLSTVYVQVDQQDVLIFFQHIVNKVGTNKTGTASDQILLHTLFSPLSISVQHI